ncbi:hemerythrin domain-containing protein [Streptomyces sp. NPDC020983]|uniref:hemerythrin domain-containing protein n=1 Tax=Streptomyces sp. NPDC020983 TaxID=3365106 RepID=UPI0037B3AC62
MYVMHDAFRRELGHMNALAARTDIDPREVFRTAPGWQLFKDVLHVHHSAEDTALWPGIRDAVEGKPELLAVLDAMEAEHARIDPALEAVDAAVAADGPGDGALAAAVEALAEGLTAHLAHEEDEGLPIVDAHVTPEILQRFGLAHSEGVGPRMPQVLPWLLEGADAADTETTLRPVPEPVRAQFAAEWRPAFAALARWGAPAA